MTKRLYYAILKVPLSRIDRFKILLLRFILPKQIIISSDIDKGEKLADRRLQKYER